ncbi:MAG TPA: hypothetical protein VHE34_13450 [Puia sp.]|uniref:MutS-related protein n=1 Tax=Puia sp. TaxID=2045100 RepID=UPI002BBB89D4|nr:hypothetical protein [Puia sp.]HVU96228.1 hypothetical protein [Puia sp.]
MPTTQYYQQKIDAGNAEIRRIQERLNGMALLRLLTFAGIIACIYFLANQYSPILLAGAIGCIAAFIICINIYYRWKDDRRLQEKLVFVYSNELGLLSGTLNRFPDGAAFLSSENYLDDLDIFGRGSLFHLFNRTTTVKGRNALASLLCRSLTEPAAIVREQAAIRVLAAQDGLRQLLTAHGLLNDDKETDIDPGNFRLWLTTPPILYRHTLRLIGIYLLIAFNTFAIGYWIARNNYTFALAGALISRLILAACGKYVIRQHEQIDDKKALLDQYAGILAAFEAVDPQDSAVLADLRARTVDARVAFERLSGISNFFNYRTNGMVNLLLNTFFLFDLHAVLRLERWKAASHAAFPGWLEAIAAIERLNSLATFAFNNPSYSYPSPVASPTSFIEAAQIAHPLISAERRVANDCTIGRDEKLILITGSNMSGKTTFLRTLGVNCLMAQCGLPVCAASFTFTPLELLTSLRIDDSLLDQTSYFMAELKKLQRIIHCLQTGAKALVLIDEILRGTNSEDKTFGSEHFIRRLLQYHCLALFATHDLALGTLEQPGSITNYCFESVIENGELHFNYQLQRGIARNRNASFLMKKMDII